eukprot:5064002-Amphidinium_carterae.1
MAERRVSERQVGQNVTSAKSKMCKAIETRRNGRIDDMYDEIVEKLKHDKHLVPDVHDALFGGMLDLTKPEKSEVEADFSSDYYFLHKVPRAWLMQKVMGVIDKRFSDSKLQKKMYGNDGEYYLKLLEYAACVKRNDPFGEKVRAAWVQEYSSRIGSLGLLPCLSVTEEGVIEWSRTGLFKLLPVFDGDCNGCVAEQHKYTEVSFAHKVTVSLGGFASVLDATWEVDKNWCVQEAVCARRDGKQPLILADFFAGCSAFEQLVAPMYKFVDEGDKRKGHRAKEDVAKEEGGKINLKRKRSYRDYVKAEVSEPLQTPPKEKASVSQKQLAAPRMPPARRLLSKKQGADAC